MRIRNIAICIIERGDDILVLEGHDAVKNETFYRPLGGGIEFGELASEAARREFQEELQAEIEILPGQQVFENIYTYDGKPGHQIMFVLNARFTDDNFYQQNEMTGNEEGQSFSVKWINKSDFLLGKKTLYPTGLAETLG